MAGNKPPWTLPAKAAYSKFDGKRAQRYFGETYEVPSFFPILSLLPQRALTYIKQTRDRKSFESSFQAIFQGLWKDHLDLAKPEKLVIALRRVFPENEVQEIISAAGFPKVKADLQAATEYVVKEQGAFGCPWFWVTNGEIQEPFFGSDRFHYMWDFLEIPHRDLELKAKI
ncbi:DSBA-like thioredoxin domain protein [Aspergillus sclerotialis]|uniref:DSBA-like thioredoxin domain protein n=1 Tax=Aspergillus sclerotialis TaxID=2070753 RepID=A0A3A2ZNR3_9EURO|nr:DSBA-like thioredoxin domain protein [Aspergillus sclerotialis]